MLRLHALPVLLILAAAQVFADSGASITLIQCRDVDNFAVGETIPGHEWESVSANNLVTPYVADLKRPLRLGSKDQISVTVIEQPAHGTLHLVPNRGTKTEWWAYLSEKNYVGHDRIVFLAEANGRRVRVIHNLLVGVTDDNNPAHCNDEKFKSIK